MTRDSQRPRKSNTRTGSSDFNKKRSFSGSDKPKRDFKSGGSSFKKREGDSSEKRSYGKREGAFGDREKKPYAKREGSFGDREKKPYAKREGGFGDREKRSFSSDKKPFTKRADGKYESTDRRSSGDRDKKSYGSKSDSFDKKPYTKREDGKYESSDKRSFGDRERKPFTKRADGKYESTDKRSFGDREKKPFVKREGGFADKEKRSYSSDKKSFSKRGDDDSDSFEKKPYVPKLSKAERVVEKSKKAGPKKTSTQQNVSDDAVRLNRYLANAGICSRREADVLIATGVVTVNGKIVTEMGYKVNPTDVVNYGGVPIKNETKKYLLLNKPKDYITTMDDPQERRTVMALIKGACKERLYPVGRLDRNTTGVLLFTNDGDMTAKLTHPKFEVRKVYHVTLNKKMTTEDYRMLNEGLELSDGFIKPDAAEFVGTGKFELGVEIHSGKNRIVRRMFEHLGYEVMKLDRVSFAGLTKKDLSRGKFRFLTEKEIGFLKMLG